jgi:hypothetical protein
MMGCLVGGILENTKKELRCDRQASRQDKEEEEEEWRFGVEGRWTRVL